MTRGTIIYVDKDDKAYSTVEFNGDMYPDGNAYEILQKYDAGFLTNYHEYEDFVIRFNKNHYKYEEKLISILSCTEERVIDVSENLTDYLYIINNSEQSWVVKNQDETTFLNKRTLGIVHFQQVEKMIHQVIHENTKGFDSELSKKGFVEIINRLRDSSDLVEQVDELFRNSRENVECDFCNGASLQISHEGTVVLLLQKLLRDAGDDIDYFIYELDYGRKYEPGMITDVDGHDIDFSSAEKVYDYLVRR